MKTTITNRRTHVAVCGMSLEKWRQWKGMIKGGLQSMHMGWSFTSGAFSSTEEIAAYINECKYLEIVYFCNGELDCQKLLEGIGKIAEAIHRHEQKPWVVLDHGLEYLEPI